MKKLLILAGILALLGMSTFLGAAQMSGGAVSGGAVSGGAPSGGGLPPALPVDEPAAGSGGVVVTEPPAVPETPVIEAPQPETPQPEVPAAPPSLSAFEDVDCSDFETERDANMFFQGYMSVLKLDVHRLDRRPYDGVVCTSLP